MGVSVWEAITFIPALSWVLGRGVVALVFGPLRWGRTRTKAYGVYVQQRIFNSMFSTLTARQLQVILPPWVKTYTAEMKKAKKPVQIEKIPNTTIEGVWFGDKNKAQTIMIYIHGGGFAMPGFDMHATMLIRAVDWFDGKLAVFAPAYTLTPYAAYPQALGECVEATRMILEGIGKNKDVLIGGDSAGGQLMLAVLSHVSGHQHPESNVVRPLDMQGRKFKGALALAPWVSSDTKKFPSVYVRNYTDVISPSAAEYWSSIYKNGRQDDYYIVPEIAPASWWSGLGGSVDDLLVLCGTDEILCDPIQSWFKNVQQGWQGGKARIVVAEGESHDEPLNAKDQKMVKAEVVGQEKTQEGAIYHWLKQKTA